MPLDIADDHDADNEPPKAKPNLGPAMDERELLAILRAEEIDASSYYTSELAKEQADAMDRYYAKRYGDEVEGRSSVTTHDIEDTINWLLPDLMRVFLQSDDLITIHSDSESDEDQTLKTAADYLRHVFFKDNRGEAILHDFAFDGLVQRMGVASIRWEDPKASPPEEIKGVPIEQIGKYLNDPEYEILEQEMRQEPVDQPQQPMPMMPQGQPGMPQQQAAPSRVVFDLRVQKTPKCGRVRIENVPPEEFAISRRARHLEAGGFDYCRREQPNIYVSDLIQLYPDKADDLNPDVTTGQGAGKDIELNSDPRTLARFQNESISTNREVSNHEKRKKVTLLTEYIWLDYDNDGVVELRQIKRVNDVILENERVDVCEFVAWSPIRVAHRLVGRSVADTIIDIQKIRTVVTRRMLDSLDQSLIPRKAYNSQMLDPEGVDALLDADIGGIVPVKGDVRAAIADLVTPDLTASGYQLLEYMDAKSEQASGVTRHQQGLQPDSANKTATGIDLLQTAAGDRIELIARWMATGLEQILSRALKLISNYQDTPRTVKVMGKALVIDPRIWSDEMAVHVHVAMAASNRQTMLANLAGIAAKQEQAIQIGGMENPVCSVTHLVNTYRRMTEIMGFKDANKFWNTEDQAKQAAQQAAQQPKQDPKMAEVQAKAEAEKARLQMDGQIKQAQMQQETQASQQSLQLETQKAQAELQMKEREAALNAQIAERKAQVEAELKHQQQQAEATLAMQQQQFEMQMAIRRQEFEERLAERQHEHQAHIAQQTVELKKSSVRFGGEVG